MITIKGKKIYKEHIGIVLLLIAAVALGCFAAWVESTRVDSQERPYNHENCQYPSRTTNPPFGCDNTDPCDPLDAAKGGSGECKPQLSYE